LQQQLRVASGALTIASCPVLSSAYGQSRGLARTFCLTGARPAYAGSVQSTYSFGTPLPTGPPQFIFWS